MGLGASVDAMKLRKMFFLCCQSNSCSSTLQPIASHYTDLYLTPLRKLFTIITAKKKPQQSLYLLVKEERG
jgi:hypothetical protein